jgi:hypothetical protein
MLYLNNLFSQEALATPTRTCRQSLLETLTRKLLEEVITHVLACSGGTTDEQVEKSL